MNEDLLFPEQAYELTITTPGWFRDRSERVVLVLRPFTLREAHLLRIGAAEPLTLATGRDAAFLAKLKPQQVAGLVQAIAQLNDWKPDNADDKKPPRPGQKEAAEADFAEVVARMMMGGISLAEIGNLNPHQFHVLAEKVIVAQRNGTLQETRLTADAIRSAVWGNQQQYQQFIGLLEKQERKGA